jgi:hypothetical protein
LPPRSWRTQATQKQISREFGGMTDSGGSMASERCAESVFGRAKGEEDE